MRKHGWRITLRPGSGLCNRLRAISGAIRLSKECGIKLVVDWFRCPIRRWSALCGMRSRFCDLFDVVTDVQFREKVRFRGDFIWDAHIYSRRNPNFYSEDDRSNFPGLVKANPEVNRWLWTCHEFYPGRDYGWLSPKDGLKMRIDSFAAKFGEHCIGIHVRRTDNKNAIACSPISLFTATMDEELASDRRTSFFLSTDDVALKDELRKRYGDKLLTCDNVSPRYTLCGEEDAVVDLFLLSRTTKIYGSFWSSFSKVAAQIGNIPLRVLTAADMNLPTWAEY